MRPIEELKLKLPWTRIAPENCIMSEITINGHNGSVIFSPDMNGWEHVSFCPYRGYVPSWDDMCKLKDFFFEDEEEAIQIHPKKSEYINIMDNCLHLWRNSKLELPS